MVKLKVGEKEMEATQLKFTPIEESYQSFLLEDGTTLRVRVIVKAVHRLEGKEGRNPETKEPNYRLNYEVDMNTLVPEKLKKSSA